ncbi:hypothetical protein EJ07DRAFT_169435 [Lizonia empirigonia]|nr:hypothetical protein EJ07DRAFT_169435 [Lizonia empirigonia]
MDSPAAVRRRRNRRVTDADRKRAPPDIPLETQISPSATFASDSPAERFMWPRFLSKLRETFSLQTDAAPESQPSVLARTQTPKLSPDSAHRVRDAARAFPPQAVARFLVSVCNEYGTDSFHYFDTAQFSAELDEFYTNDNASSRLDVAFVCLAHAVFALGSQWATLVKPEGSNLSPFPRDGDPGRMFYQNARSLIPDVLELNSIRTVQATFVIGVYLLPASAISSSYVYLGLALSKALALDLHLESEEAHISDTEKELRRRLWWAMYNCQVEQTKVCGHEIITVHPPTRLPTLDSQHAFDDVDHQIANAQLTMILDRIEEPIAERGSLVDLDIALKTWKRSLPTTLKLESIHPRSSSYRATFHLYLNYYFATIAMGKMSVVAQVRSFLKIRLGRDAQAISEEHDNHLSQACCSVATSLVLLAGILERDSDYERHVSFGLDSLRKMAEGNATATAGLTFVEALQSIAEEAVLRVTIGPLQLEIKT